MIKVDFKGVPSKPRKFQPSPQQQAFFDWCVKGTGSCTLEAVAGSGKSTTLIHAASMITGQVAMLVYNKKNGVELTEKLNAAGVSRDKAEAGTVHSFGMRAYRRAYPKVQVEKKKLSLLAPKCINPNLEQFHDMIIKLVSLAKQRALGVIGNIDNTDLWHDIADHFDVFWSREGTIIPQNECIEAAKTLLRWSNKQRDVIDFDDMVYLPLLLQINFWQYDVVMVDEAQDTNPARRELVRALVKPNGRVIAVGDRHQAIYGFTGADNDSLDLITNAFNCVQMPLTVSYRCPKDVVAFAQQWVSHIHSHPDAATGSVSSSTWENFIARKDLNGEAAIVCRNTKPLVAAAFALIRAKVACRVEGRDIGLGLKKLINRWKVKSLHSLLDRLDKHSEAKLKEYSEKQQDNKAQTLTDQVETIKVIIEQCLSEGKTTLRDADAYIDTLFDDDIKGMLVLSTIHKSKGREWERVFWLDRANTCPSKWAKKDWEAAQEVNLMYVAATRAKQELIELDTPPAKSSAGAQRSASVIPVPKAVDAKRAVSAPVAGVPPAELISKEEKRRADKKRRAKERRERRAK